MNYNIYKSFKFSNFMIQYKDAEDINQKIQLIVSALNLNHINSERLFCIRSNGSKTRGIIARCHSLPKIMQHSLKTNAAYIIEVVSENFDNLSEEQKTKTLIHELLHIPKTFGGGFIHHNVVNRRKVDSLYSKFMLSSDRKI